MESFLPFIDSAEGAAGSTDDPPNYSRLSSDAGSPLLEDGGPRAELDGEGDTRATDDGSDWDTCDTTDEFSPIMSATMPAPTKLRGERVTASRIHEPHWRRLTRRYRLAEFACSIVMMGAALVFALIGVHERT